MTDQVTGASERHEDRGAVGSSVQRPVRRPAGADLLDMEYINSLPQPLIGRRYGSESWWPIHDIELQTGLVLIDVCGKLDVKHIGDFACFKDDLGNAHEPDDFFADPESWVNREPPNAELTGRQRLHGACK